MALIIITVIALALLCVALVTRRVAVHRRHGLAEHREAASIKEFTRPLMPADDPAVPATRGAPSSPSPLYGVPRLSPDQAP